jgi:hypothetical protein
MEKLNEQKLETLSTALTKLETSAPVYSGVVTDWISGIGTNLVVNFLLKQLASDETREKLHGFVYWIADQTNDTVDAVLDKLIEYYTGS